MPTGRSWPEHTDYLGRSYFGSLDGLRCASIIAVLWHHTHEGFAWLPASERGFLGVDMFFVVSGFLIVTLLLRERQRAGSISLQRFYMRRTLRIFPIYYGVLLVIAAYFGLVRPGRPMAKSFFHDLPYFVTYMSDWIDTKTILFFTWSLAAEEQFYLVWPPIEKWLEKLAIPLLVAAIAVNQLINFKVADPWLYAWFGFRQADLMILQITFTPICLGVLLAHVLHSKRGFDRVVRVVGWQGASAFLAIALVVACNLRGDLGGVPRLLIQTLMTLLLAACVVREDHTIAGLLRLPPIKRIGTVSYGMYMYHMFVVAAVTALLNRVKLAFPYDRFLLTTVLTYAVAELSFRCYESPFLRLKHFFDPKAKRTYAVREVALASAVEAPGPSVQSSAG
jgi:peptidoglycan/LPS O-acetylase OafA/YrhL